MSPYLLEPFCCCREYVLYMCDNMFGSMCFTLIGLCKKASIPLRDIAVPQSSSWLVPEMKQKSTFFLLVLLFGGCSITFWGRRATMKNYTTRWLSSQEGERVEQKKEMCFLKLSVKKQLGVSKLLPRNGPLYECLCWQNFTLKISLSERQPHFTTFCWYENLRQGDIKASVCQEGTHWANPTYNRRKEEGRGREGKGKKWSASFNLSSFGYFYSIPKLYFFQSYVSRCLLQCILGLHSRRHAPGLGTRFPHSKHLLPWLSWQRRWSRKRRLDATVPCRNKKIVTLTYIEESVL